MQHTGVTNLTREREDWIFQVVSQMIRSLWRMFAPSQLQHVHTFPVYLPMETMVSGYEERGTIKRETMIDVIDIRERTDGRGRIEERDLSVRGVSVTGLRDNGGRKDLEVCFGCSVGLSDAAVCWLLILHYLALPF